MVVYIIWQNFTIRFHSLKSVNLVGVMNNFGLVYNLKRISNIYRN